MSTATSDGGGCARATVETGYRGGGRGRPCLGGGPAHHEYNGVVGEVGGGRSATNRWSDGGGRRGRDEDGGGNCGVPGPIPTEGRSSSARRSSWRRRLALGRSEATARCVGVLGGRELGLGRTEGEKERELVRNGEELGARWPSLTMRGEGGRQRLQR